MVNYNSFFDEKEKKAYSLYIKNQLDQLNLPANFISKNFHTKEEWKIFLEKIYNCDTYHAFLPEQKKTVNIILCNSYTICPICSSVKRFQIIKKIKPYYDCIIKMQSNNTLYLYEATATIEGSTDLSSDYEKIRDSWTNFNQMGRKREYRFSSGEASKIIGSLMSIEITKNKNKWHVHAHILIVCNQKLDFQIYSKKEASDLYKKYGFGMVPKELLDNIVLKKVNGIPVSKITEQWLLATKGTGINFWISQYNPYRNSKGEKTTPIKKLFELCKYVTKISNLSPSDAFKVWDELQHKKRVTTSGIFGKSDRELWFRLLDENSLLYEFLEATKKTEKKIDKNEQLKQIKYNQKTGDYDESDSDLLGWFTSKEYGELLSERNYIIHSKKNESSNLIEEYKNGNVSSSSFIFSKNSINENHKNAFIDLAKKQKNIYNLKINNASRGI